jgi:hypothetical protein
MNIIDIPFIVEAKTMGNLKTKMFHIILVNRLIGFA